MNNTVVVDQWGNVYNSWEEALIGIGRKEREEED